MMMTVAGGSFPVASIGGATRWTIAFLSVSNDRCGSYRNAGAPRVASSHQTPPRAGAPCYIVFLSLPLSLSLSLSRRHGFCLQPRRRELEHVGRGLGAFCLQPQRRELGHVGGGRGDFCLQPRRRELGHVGSLAYVSLSEAREREKERGRAASAEGQARVESHSD